MENQTPQDVTSKLYVRSPRLILVHLRRCTGTFPRVKTYEVGNGSIRIPGLVCVGRLKDQRYIRE